MIRIMIENNIIFVNMFPIMEAKSNYQFRSIRKIHKADSNSKIKAILGPKIMKTLLLLSVL